MFSAASFELLLLMYKLRKSGFEEMQMKATGGGQLTMQPALPPNEQQHQLELVKMGVGLGICRL